MNLSPMLLQAIGMTGRQLKQMLMTEGIYYAGGSLLVSLALSCCIAPLLGASLGKLLWFFTFHFTLLPILAVLPFFVLFGLAIPLDDLSGHSQPEHRRAHTGRLKGRSTAASHST